MILKEVELSPEQLQTKFLIYDTKENITLNEVGETLEDARSIAKSYYEEDCENEHCLPVLLILRADQMIRGTVRTVSLQMEPA